MKKLSKIRGKKKSLQGLDHREFILDMSTGWRMRFTAGEKPNPSTIWDQQHHSGQEIGEDPDKCLPSLWLPFRRQY